MTLSKTFAQMVRARMDELKISQAELSRKSGVAEATICRLYKGTIINSRIDTFQALCQELKIEFKIGGDENAML